MTDAGLRAVIFDMDGLLLDSEPLWQRAEIEVFATVGVSLRREDCRRTMGMRVDAVVQHWLAERGWDAAATPPAAVGAAIVDRVIELVRQHGSCNAGVQTAVDRVRKAGLRMALASSSPLRLIGPTLQALGLEAVFEVVHSAEGEASGKPSPDVYLTTASRLGVSPAACLALEDSLAGLRAAKAAGMRCVMVPDASLRSRPELAAADAVLRSLEEFDPAGFKAASASA